MKTSQIFFFGGVGIVGSDAPAKTFSGQVTIVSKFSRVTEKYIYVKHTINVAIISFSNKRKCKSKEQVRFHDTTEIIDFSYDIHVINREKSLSLLF